MRERRQGGFLLAKVHRLSARVFSRLLAREGIELNSAQGRVLFALWGEDGLRIGDLAQRTALSKSALTSMLDGLEEQGYVERVRDPSDRRAIRVARTAKDRALEDDHRRASDAMTEVFYRDFAPHEIVAFERYLGRILANLERETQSAGD